MAELIPIGDTKKRQNRLIDVIFVHGLHGDPLKSWGPLRPDNGGDRDSMLHWLIDEPEMRDIGVWTLSHESSRIRNSNCQSLLREELSENMLELFKRTFGGNSLCLLGCRIAWIGHSEGGNVIKSFLRFCQQRKDIDLTASNIIAASHHIYFIDTPHLGSWVTPLVAGIPMMAPRLWQLKPASPEIRELHTWYYKHHKASLDVKTFSFIQSASLFKVVGDGSARFDHEDATTEYIDRNHIDIAKPPTPQHLPYAQIKHQLYNVYKVNHDLLDKVSSLPAALSRNNSQVDAVRFEHSFARLIIFVFPVPESYKPNQYNFKIQTWLFSSNGLEYSPQCEVYISDSRNLDDKIDLDNVAFSRLHELIERIYSSCLDTRVGHELNQSKKLLVHLYLPHTVLESDSLHDCIKKLQLLMEAQEAFGIPVFLGCSSRYPQTHGGEFNYSRREQRRLSEEIYDIAIKSNEPLKKLNWANIDLGSESMADQMGNQLTTTDFVDYGQIAWPYLDKSNEDGGERDGVDPLYGNHGIFLIWNSKIATEQPEQYKQRMRKLLKKGFPLIWKQGAAEGFDSNENPGEIMLGWRYSEFLERFHDYKVTPLTPATQDQAKIRRYIRNGILFWEDHRFLPPKVLPFRSPLR
jgi:hypothetical protein